MEYEKLIMIRKSLNLSQKDFAIKLGLKRSTISDMECSRSNITQSTKLLLYNIFNVNPNWFENNIGEMFLEVNHYYKDFIDIFNQLDLPLQEFLLDTAKRLLDLQDKI